ncbi:MAG TPA: ABC transporter ATP-binding protein [Candidatus Didemnitutus sp.]|nr:ABC transporter ATP-binding protein [Candidatus Didemnitutus sp.]
MSQPVISVEGLSKRYILGHQRSKNDGLRHVAENVLRAPLQWFRAKQEQQNKTREEFWALKDVSFEVKKGEVVGIIGRNGAGKSTLLKILSRITEPTKGRIQIDGRVASLLEVGTGFHQELTGRENIFLNGAILGMSRLEIKRRFDEIVAFSEVERFLDTPVKRYSSGMYVRLAFAVAAHLEPEILIIDEVLAVGDAEFQKKCLGKMHEVAEQHGRTVLFVSHNMAAVKSLTTRGIVLKSGGLVFDGAAEPAIQAYTELTATRSDQSAARRISGPGMHTKLVDATLINESGAPVQRYQPGSPLRVRVVLETDGTQGLSLETFLLDSGRTRLGLASTYQFHGQSLPTERGTYACVLELEPLWLASGTYYFDVATSVVNHNWDLHWESAIEFDVPFSSPTGRTWDFKQSFGFGALANLVTAPIEFERVTPVSNQEASVR